MNPGGTRAAGRVREGPGERGSATLELVVLVPVVVLMLWLIVYCIRLSDVRLRIEDVAHQAARAASSERTSAAALDAARTTAARALDEAGMTCRAHRVALSGTPRPGSSVTVTVACVLDLHDIDDLLQLPGTHTLTARYTSPVDTYRGRALGFAKSDVSWDGNRSADVEGSHGAARGPSR